MILLTHNFHFFPPWISCRMEMLDETNETKKSKVSCTGFFGINASLSGRVIFRFQLKSVLSAGNFKAVFLCDIKTSIFYHKTTSPDAQINCPVPMHTSLYKNRRFLLTILKQLEKSLQTSNRYIGPYVSSTLLFSVGHSNHLRSEKRCIFTETFMK